MKEQLNEKIQVLISRNDLQDLNRIILNKALESGKRPLPLSAYIRELIKEDIDKHVVEQKSFVKEHTDKIK